jgi:hypothetical protein
MCSVELIVHKHSLLVELVTHLIGPLERLFGHLVEQLSILLDHGRIWTFAQPCLLTHRLHQYLLLSLRVRGHWPNQITLCHSRLFRWRMVLPKLRRLVV